MNNDIYKQVLNLKASYSSTMQQFKWYHNIVNDLKMLYFIIVLKWVFLHINIPSDSYNKYFVVVERLILLRSQWPEFPSGSSTVYVWVLLSCIWHDFPLNMISIFPSELLFLGHWFVIWFILSFLKMKT